MSEDTEFIKNYVPGRLYINPSAQSGAYAAIADVDETIIDEFDVGDRFKICVTAFFVSEKKDFNTFKIHKLQFRKRGGWFLAESVSFNGFQLESFRKLIEIISSLDLSDASKTRFDLGKISTKNISQLITAENAGEIERALSNSNLLTSDIFALGRKRKAIMRFKEMMSQSCSEAEWQCFFEENEWIFGIGLNFVALEKVAKKFEAVTTGSSFDKRGKRADGLLKTKAEVSQFVLAEIKTPNTALLKQSSPYRADCWAISAEVAGAVAQCQKTSFMFAKERFEESFTDDEGNKLDETAYSIQPKTFLIVGNLSEIERNSAKISSFELFRKSISSPEIITFDELLYRAEALVENIDGGTPNGESQENEEIPF